MKIKDINGAVRYKSRHNTMHETIKAALAEGTSLQQCDLRRRDMSWWHLADLDLSGCDLRWCKLPNDLKGVNLSHCRLPKDLSECDLLGADLSHCDLRKCKLPQDLRGCNLSDAILPGEWIDQWSESQLEN